MVTNVTSLTGNGLKDWLLQRFSAIILAVYTLMILIFISSHEPLSFAVWSQLFSNPWMRIFSLVALLSLIAHAWIGVWTVSTDYLPNQTLRLIIQMLVLLSLFVFLIWGITILWGI